MYKSIIFLIFTALLSCENENSISAWKITETNMINPFLEKAGFVQITNDAFVFSDSSGSVSYPVITSKDKVLINTETQKWIFAIEHHSKSSMILKERYSKKPLIIKLSRIH